MDAVSHFSQSYSEARDKFLAAASTADATITSLRHPQRGPRGESLFLDVARVGSPDATRVLLIGSGTHGVEGFFGSAAQTALLHGGLAKRLPRDVRIIFLHAINPYGFAHTRRVNEDNVDINRNFLDHTQPHPVNEPYAMLADAIAPCDFSEAGRATAIDRLLRFRAERGEAALQEAVSGGQYTHPDGLFYGGTSETWANQTVRKLVAEELANASHAVLVDFHTGLGDYAAGEVIINVPPDSSAYRRAKAWWGDRMKTTKDGSSISADLVGPLKIALPEMCPHAEVTASSLECGTVPGMEVFFAMQAENWLHHHGGLDHPDGAAIKQRLRDAFYVDTDDWKRAVWEHARTVVDQAIVGLAS